MSNAVCLALLVSVTVHAASLANLASAATYYASPQGEGDGTSADKPFVVSRFWEEAQPGGTLVLLDGVYTGPDSMITPPREVQETPGAPIVIRAANDGQVTPMNKRIKQLAGIEYLELGHHFDSMPVPYFFDRPSFLGAKKGTPEYLARITEAYRVAAEYLDRKGWLEGSYVYCVDEVVVHRHSRELDLALLNQVFEAIHAAHPKIRIFGAETPSPVLRGMNIWCMNINSFDEDVLQEQHALGNQVWWYNGYQDPRPGTEGFPGNYAFPPEALDRESFTVQEDGRLDRQDLLHARLGERKSWQAPAKSFQVRYPVDGQFIVYVPELGGGPRPAPRLTVTLDGNVVLEQELLPYGPADRYDPRAYYQKYPIDVPAGAHTICVANTGGGTITTAFELTNYVRRNGPNLEVRGMQTDDYILLWLKHPEFNWMYRRMGMTSDSQPAGRLTLRDVPDETWSARWMDTVDARPVGQETVTSKDGVLVLKTPPTAKSVVVRLQRRHIAGSQGSE